MEAFIVNAVCFTKFEKQGRVSARAKLHAFNAALVQDKDLAVAEYEQLFDVCTN